MKYDDFRKVCEREYEDRFGEVVEVNLTPASRAAFAAEMAPRVFGRDRLKPDEVQLVDDFVSGASISKVTNTVTGYPCPILSAAQDAVVVSLGQGLHRELVLLPVPERTGDADG